MSSKDPDRKLDPLLSLVAVVSLGLFISIVTQVVIYPNIRDYKPDMSKAETPKSIQQIIGG